MSLRIRRGTNSQRTGVTLDIGEIAYTTDTKKLYVGDGITAGGVNILSTSAGTGLTWNSTTQSLDVIPGGGALTEVVQDTSPQLGGNLDLNGKNITGAGDISTTGTIVASQGLGGNLSLNGNNITGVGNINISGSITGTNFSGDILATDATTILNHSNKTLAINSISLNSGFGSVTGPLLSISTTATNFIKQTYNTSWINFIQNQSANALSSPVAFVRSRGTLASPAAVQTGDFITNLTTAAHTGTNYVPAGSLTNIVSGTVTATAVPSAWLITAADAAGVINTTLSIDAYGVTSNRYIKVGNYDAAGVGSIASPSAGMMVFNTTTQKYQGYVDDTGLAAGGPSNSTPGWVDLN